MYLHLVSDKAKSYTFMSVVHIFSKVKHMTLYLSHQIKLVSLY